jgi:hypothetical protein
MCPTIGYCIVATVFIIKCYIKMLQMIKTLQRLEKLNPELAIVDYWDEALTYEENLPILRKTFPSLITGDITFPTVSEKKEMVAVGRVAVGEIIEYDKMRDELHQDDVALRAKAVDYIPTTRAFAFQDKYPVSKGHMLDTLSGSKSKRRALCFWSR